MAWYGMYQPLSCLVPDSDNLLGLSPYRLPDLRSAEPLNEISPPVSHCCHYWLAVVDLPSPLLRLVFSCRNRPHPHPHPLHPPPFPYHHHHHPLSNLLSSSLPAPTPAHQRSLGPPALVRRGPAPTAKGG